MKTLLIGMMVALLLVGCGGGDSQGNVDMEGTAPNEDALGTSVDRNETAPEEDPIETAVDWKRLQDRGGVTYVPNTETPFSGYAKRAYENEQVEVLAQFKDGFVVRLKQWQENGTPRWDVGYMEGKVGIEEMPYKRDPKNLMEYGHGPVTAWHENGQKLGEGNYKDGKEDGLWTYWYENGQKQKELTYKEGKRDDGLVTRWHENGQKKNERNYKDGKRDGLETWWNENGQKASEGNYEDGWREGLWTAWYENGQKKIEDNWKDGKLLSAVVWKPNGEKCPVTNLKDGNGVVVEYNEDETEGIRTTYRDGEPVVD